MVVVVDRRAVVVVVLLDFRESDFDLSFDSTLVVVAVVEVGGGAGDVVTVVVVDGGTAAAPTAGPAVAPGRGSVLAGDVGAGDDVASAEGLAGAASVEGEGGAVSGVGVGAATSSATGTDRAARRALKTSGWDRGDTRAVENRDETSWTPNNPRSTPLAVPRAHVTTRTRRTAKWWRPPVHEGVKTKLNQHQDSRLGQ